LLPKHPPKITQNPTPNTQYWKIAQKTAKRDIADLKKRGLIEYSGAPKNGFYCLKRSI